MKIFGLFLIFFSSSFFGFMVAGQYLSILSEAKRADGLLRNIAFLIKNENMTVPEIFENIGREGDTVTKDFLSLISPEKIDEISFAGEKSGFYKNKTVGSYLESAFSVLGKYSADEQISEIENCRRKLGLFLENNRSNLIFKARLSRYSGVLAGILAVIIFV